jgi:hypothetical protein
VRPADEILDQKDLIKQGPRQKEAVIVDFPTVLQAARTADGVNLAELHLPIDFRFLAAQIGLPCRR